MGMPYHWAVLGVIITPELLALTHSQLVPQWASRMQRGMGSNLAVLWELIVQTQLIARASSGLVSLVAPESGTPEHCPEMATLIFRYPKGQQI